MDEWISLSYKNWKMVQCCKNLPNLFIGIKKNLHGFSEIEVCSNKIHICVKNPHDAFLISNFISMSFSGGNRLIESKFSPVFKLRIFNIPTHEMDQLIGMSDELKIALIIKWSTIALSLGYNGLLFNCFSFFGEEVLNEYFFISNNAYKLGIYFGFELNFIKTLKDFLAHDFLSKINSHFVFIDRIENFFSGNFGFLYHESVIESAILICEKLTSKTKVFIKVNSDISENALTYMLVAIPKNCYISFDCFTSDYEDSNVWSFIKKRHFNEILPFVPIFNFPNNLLDLDVPILHSCYTKMEGRVKVSSLVNIEILISFNKHVPNGKGPLSFYVWLIGMLSIGIFSICDLYELWSKNYDLKLSFDQSVFLGSLFKYFLKNKIDVVYLKNILTNENMSIFTRLSEQMEEDTKKVHPFSKEGLFMYYNGIKTF